MSSYHSSIEEAVFQSLVPRLEADGFSVFPRPSLALLPPFLEDAAPDLIAIKDGKRIAVTIVPGNTTGRADRLGRLLASHPEWEHRVIYAAPHNEDVAPPRIPATIIKSHLDRIEAGFDAMESSAALLWAWSALEAAARSIVPGDFERPQTTAALLEGLAAQGRITPDEADQLRRIGQLRNQTAHGGLTLSPDRRDIEDLISVTRTLLDDA